MKTFAKFLPLRIVLLAIILSPLIWSCTTEDTVPEVGEVSFTYQSSTGSSGRTSTINTPAFVKYIMRNEAGEVMSDKVPVYKFGATYTSERQTLPVGRYVLNEYFVLNQENEIIYAAVLKGSPNALLVSKTLPMAFDITHEETTYVSPDVLPVTSISQPEDFGYAKWSFNISAQLVKFILPIHPSLITNFKSATLSIKQGDYSHTEQLQGTPSTQLFANVLVKINVPVTISLLVDADDIYSEGYPQGPFGGGQEDLQNRTSISQMEFSKILPSIQGSEITIQQFKHKFGKGWNFKFAEITTYALNGSWIKIKYERNELSARYVKITTNASQFDYVGEIRTDKIIWSQPVMHQEGNVITIYHYIDQIKGAGAPFGQPVCENGICTLTADFNFYPKYNEFVSACDLNEWKAFDAYTQVGIIHNGQTNHITCYFKIEEDVPNAWPGRTTLEIQSSNDPGYIRN